MNEFAIADVLPGKLNALVKNLMSQMKISDPNEAVRRVNSGEWTVSQVVLPWREENGVIYFSVVSNGMTGEEWIAHFGEDNVSKWAKDVLRSPDFQPTKGVKYEVAVLKGELFSDEDRVTHKIRSDAEKKELGKPNAELACLIRDKFSNEEIEKMGLKWIVTMHEPIKDSDGGPFLLSADRGDCVLAPGYGRPGGSWRSGGGFAFVRLQVS